MSSSGYEFQCYKCGESIGFGNAYGSIDKPLCRKCNDKKIFKNKKTIQEEIDEEKEKLGLNYEDL